MTVREAVFSCCQQKGISLSALAEIVGMHKSNLSRVLSEWGRAGAGIGSCGGASMKVDTLRRLVEACGGQLVVQFLDDNMDPSEEFVIDGEEEGVLERDNRCFPNGY